MKLCQLEFQSQNAEESAAFVEAILGWKKVPVSIQDQIIIEVPDNSPYGISIRSTQNLSASAQLLAYFESEFPLPLLKEKIIAQGGTILSDIKAVTGYGQILTAKDPGGISFGFYYAKFEGPRPQ